MPDPEKMSQEEIEKALEDIALEKVDASEFTGEAEPEPQPEPEVPAPEPETEPEPAPEAETAAEPEVQEADILRAQLAEMEARAQHYERLAGSHAGKLGFLEQRLKNLEARPIQQGYVEEAEPTLTIPAPSQEDGSFKTWVIAQAIKSGVEDFRREHQDADEFQQGIAKYLESSGYDPRHVLESNDPLRAQQESKRVLEEAYFAARADKEATRRSELQQKRADQIANLEKLKKKAAPSASGNAPPPRPTQKTPNEMSREELDAALAEATGGRW